MYVKSIEKIKDFTRPIHTILRRYGSNKVAPATATLFFVNEDGWAVTCKHVAQLLTANQKKYLSFVEKRKKLPKDRTKLKELEKGFGFSEETIVQLKSHLVNCVDKFKDIKIVFHDQHDLALLRFEGFQDVQYKSHAIFLKDINKIKPGKNLCRYGYPFPEFENYKYNEQTDDIEFTKEGRMSTPSFPIDGIITRRLADTSGEIIAIEMSTPGLKGQSGGPLFDDEGIVYGMQASTNHLYLGFDMIDKEIVSEGKTTKITNQPFLHVGQCIHVDVIKGFLQSNNVKYYEE